MAVLTPVHTAEAVELTLAYIAELDRLAEAVGAAVRQVFEDLAHTDRADIEAFMASATPYTNAGIAEASDLAAAYIAEVTHEPMKATDIVMPVVDFEGPFHRTWHELSEGMPYDQAKQSGASVAEMTGYDAASNGADARMASPGVKTRGARRVLSPGACDWCQVVATQIYKSVESASFGHHNCKCRAIAITGERVADATKAINKARLVELRASGAVQKASDARERNRQRARDAFTAQFE